MKLFLTFLLLMIILGGCQNKGKNKSKALTSKKEWVQVPIYKDTINVKIPIEGKLIAWKKMDILSPLNVKLIALLVEKGEAVQRGDLLLSLWPVNRKNDFNPININAPLTGVVREIYYTINDTIPLGKPIVLIENRENLTLKATLSSAQMYFIKRNQNVTMHYQNLIIRGAVLDVDNESKQITVIVPNQEQKIDRDLFVQGFVELGKRPGNFLPRKKFGFYDSLRAKVKVDIEITLYRIGRADDSLALIFPTLPDVDSILIQKNLDNRK